MEGLDIEFVASHAAPTAELLRFYRSKVANFESERTEQLRRLGDAEAQNAELHRLRWEARAREEEIAELQRALSDSRLFLFDEREHALKLAAENDGLKSQEVEDRRKIAHLLSITEPLTHEVSTRSHLMISTSSILTIHTNLSHLFLHVLYTVYFFS
jgi:coiled-coil domain-containing protein 77